MQAEVKLDAEAAIAVFADDGAGLEVPTREAAEAEAWRDRVKAGEAFVAETGDPGLGESRQGRANVRFRLYLDEPVPPAIEQACSARSGSFLLRLPSGRLRVVALGTGSPEMDEPPATRTFDVPPGDYSLSLLEGSIQGGESIAAREKAPDDAADWRLYERINHFGALGCLAIALGMLFVLIPYTRREYWFLLPLFLLPTCAFIFLRRLPGYARVSNQIRERSEDPPQYVLSMQRVDTVEGLEGGWYRCR